MLKEMTAVQKAVVGGLVVVIIVAAVFVAYRRRVPPPPPTTPYSAELPQPPAEQIVVDVSGAVVHPGLYTLPAGTRIYQAIKVAGWFAPGADRHSVNLAKRLKDGDQVLVKVQTPAPPASAQPPPRAKTTLPAAPPPASTTSPGSSAPAVAYPISLNQATLTQLMELPGIGEKTAQKILEYRQRYGPFKRTEELMLIEGIGPKKFAQIKAYVAP